MLFGATCVTCSSPGSVLCPPCAERLRAAPPFAAPPGLDSCAALLRYDDASRGLVVGLKYNNARLLVSRLADALVALVPADPAGTPGSVELVTWAPTTAARRRGRGFDHAHLLAAALARRLGRPCRALLARGPGPPQTGRARAERWEGPRFTLERGVPVVAGGVLVVDDVITTGATLAAAAAVLRSAGCPAVHGVATARTP